MILCGVNSRKLHHLTHFSFEFVHLFHYRLTSYGLVSVFYYVTGVFINTRPTVWSGSLIISPGSLEPRRSRSLDRLLLRMQGTGRRLISTRVLSSPFSNEDS
ncbi:hypothetical protein BYT27DRAFT_6783098 [Phlegmacium glaucopus]|nr:hypothetical protein BYT27DRAFT_6783098 [Phlegmacium glaucopus]